MVLLIVCGVLGSTALAGVPPTEPLNCTVYQSEKESTTVGFKVGSMLFMAGPEVTRSRSRGVAWDKVVQGLIARYVELCMSYNAGLVDSDEYQLRRVEIEQFHQEAKALEGRLIDETKSSANSAQDALDRALSGRSLGSSNISSSEKEQLDDALQQLLNSIGLMEW